MAQKAKRRKLKAAVAFVGPSGSGKTLGALITAYGMMKAKYPDASDEEVWNKIGVVDTEHERSLVYADMTKAGVHIGEFWYEGLDAPYTVERYEKAVISLMKEGCEVIILDSISHAWDNDGGLLDLQKSFGGRFQDWKEVNPYYRNFISIITGEKYNVHVLSTIRAKQAYEVEKNDMEKLEVKKLGLKPVQRDSLEYEFQIVFNPDMSHRTVTTKDNSGIFEGAPFIITPDVGKALYEWLEAGVDPVAEREKRRQELIQKIKEVVEVDDVCAKTLADLEHRAKDKPYFEWDLKLLEKAWTSYVEPLFQAKDADKKTKGKAKELQLA